MGIFFRRVFFPVPIAVEVGAVKAAFIFLDFQGIDEGIDRAGGPFGFQYHGSGQYGVLVKVEYDAQVVEVVAEKQGFFVIHAVGAAYGEIVLQGDVIVLPGFQFIADIHPVFGEFVQQVGHPEEGGADGFGKFGDMLAGDAAYLEELGDVGEFILKRGFIDVFDADVRFVHHHDERAAGAEEFDGIEPVVEAPGFFFFARVPDKKVEGAFGEEELVGGVEDVLAAEIPEMNVDIAGLAVGKGAGELPGLDIDAAGGVFFARRHHESVVFEFFHEGGFAHIAGADEEEFGFQEKHGSPLDFGEIIFDGGFALV